MRVVVMGPSGAGKSAVGTAVAAGLGIVFVNGDALHPDENVAKMSAGVALTDEDRMPWLDAVGRALREASDGVVVACSALARRYRDRIRVLARDAQFVELVVEREELDQRMHERSHFMPPALLDSQLGALEHLQPDEAGFAIANDVPLEDVVAGILEALDTRGS